MSFHRLQSIIPVGLAGLLVACGSIDLVDPAQDGAGHGAGSAVPGSADPGSPDHMAGSAGESADGRPDSGGQTGDSADPRSTPSADSSDNSTGPDGSESTESGGSSPAGSEGPTSPADTDPRFRIALMDAPVDDAEAVYVFVDQVALHYRGTLPADSSEPADDQPESGEGAPEQAEPTTEEAEPSAEEGTTEEAEPADESGEGVDSTESGVRPDDPGNGNNGDRGNSGDEQPDDAGSDDTTEEPETGGDDPAEGDESAASESGSEGGESWLVLDIEPAMYNLLDLQNNVRALLADQAIPAGEYTEIRLLLGCEGEQAPSIVIDGVEEELSIPSGCQSGIKMPHQFSADAGDEVALVMDFDVRRSIHRTGNGRFIMRPVVRLVDVALSGTISGRVTPADADAAVYAFEAGTVDFEASDPYAAAVSSTMPDEEGQFALGALPAGSYDVVIAAEGYTSEVIVEIELGRGEELVLFDVELAPEAL